VVSSLEPSGEGHHIPRDCLDGTVVADRYIFDASTLGEQGRVSAETACEITHKAR